MRLSATRGTRLPGNTVWHVPAVTIEDMPRFSWRGGHLDVGRHFMPKEFVKKYIDLLALHKMNTFHWHLTDDQGWRIEIKKYPRLTGSARGATRRSSDAGATPRPTYDGSVHGGFYTQEDAREIVAYAGAVRHRRARDRDAGARARRHRRISRARRNSANPSMSTRWGVYADILNAEKTIAFMQDVLAEVIEIFPSGYIHIGGDEADKAKWKVSPRTQERIKELGLKDEHELQSWFIRQMDAFLTSASGGWSAGTRFSRAGSRHAAVMSWRGTRAESRRRARARRRHDTHDPRYFDYYQSGTHGEPLAIGGFSRSKRSTRSSRSRRSSSRSS